MSAPDSCRVVEHHGASEPCLIKILKQFGWRVFIIRRRLSRLKTRIQIAEKKNQPATTLESQQQEELSVDLERYQDLLNDCAEAIHERTGIPTSKLVEVATSTTEGEEWDCIYAELKKLDERRVNAELYKALLSRDPDALVSVGLLPSSESSPRATKSDPTRMPDEFVESDYVEPMLKRELAFLFGVDRVTIARRIQSSELRVMPGTLYTAKKVRVHGDDFPAGLKRPNERKQKLSSRPKNGKRQ